MWFDEATMFDDFIWGSSTAELNYWTGARFGSDDYTVYVIDGEINDLDSSYCYDDKWGYGVRPVIKILESSVK